MPSLRPPNASDVPSLAAEVLAARAAAEPSTLEGSSSPVHMQRCGSSSSNEAAAPAGDAHLSDAAPLLPDVAGPSAPGLRRRQAHEESLL